MNRSKKILYLGLLLSILVLLPVSTDRYLPVFSGHIDLAIPAEPIPSDSFLLRIPITQPIPIGRYFEYMDSLVVALDSLLPYPISEHLIVRANPWIIDTLAETDYYRQMAKGVFVYDQKKQLALRTGDTLGIPDSLHTQRLLEKMAATTLEVNIPEFTLRILEGTDTLYRFPVRVGQHKSKYLAMAGREIDLRTDVGEGKIVRLNRNPSWINPTDNKPYYETNRDDHRRTTCPRIPWIEPEINGQRLGDLIHPTTNPKTLGKAYSNGCIGLKEADSWYVYYHAPLNTRVVFKYDLRGVTETGDTVRLRDIYQLYAKKQKRK